MRHINASTHKSHRKLTSCYNILIWTAVQGNGEACSSHEAENYIRNCSFL